MEKEGVEVPCQAFDEKEEEIERYREKPRILRDNLLKFIDWISGWNMASTLERKKLHGGGIVYR